MAKQVLPILKIRLDGNTQPRVELDESLIAEYAEAYQADVKMPPLEVMFDGASYWLWDGFHRRWGAARAGMEKLPCNVTSGTREDAQWASYGANKSHGLRRTNADKAKAVKAALKHPETKSDREIAEHVGVHFNTVAKYRAELIGEGTITNCDSRTGKDGRTINTSNIGSKPNRPTMGREVPCPHSQRMLGMIDGQEPVQPAADYQPAFTSPHDTAAYAKASNACHVSHNTGMPEWYTPEEYLEAARSVLESIDLDPASSVIAQKRVRAGRFYTVEQDGLKKSWRGKVWLNPPYTAGLVDKFVDKLLISIESGSVPEAIILVNNATDTAWFQTAASKASAACFPKGRIKFLDENGKPGAPLQGQALLYFGQYWETFIDEFSKFGACMEVMSK